MTTILRPGTRALLALLLIGALCACSPGSDPAEAQESTAAAAYDLDTTETGPWLGRMNEAWQRTPLRVDFSVETAFFGAGFSGTLIKGDHRRYRLEIEAGLFGGSDKTMKYVYVCDGETFWQETNLGFASTVMKSSCDGSDLPFGHDQQNPGGMVLSWLEYISRAPLEDFDAQVAVDGDTIRMRASPPDMGDDIVLTVDSKSGFPRSLVLEVDTLALFTITYSDVTYLRRSQVPSGTFSYKPPRGTRVVQLGK